MEHNPPENEESDQLREEEEEEEEEEELQDWGDWDDDNEEGELLCLFCDSKFSSSTSLFEHCCSSHDFDFNGIRKTFALDFYGSFKLINYVRSQVAENKCWKFGLPCQPNQDQEKHKAEIRCALDNDKYLRPFLEDDPLLYGFGDDEEIEDECTQSTNKEELMKQFGTLEEVFYDTEKGKKTSASENARKTIDHSVNGCVGETSSSDSMAVNVTEAKELPTTKNLKSGTFCNGVRKDVKAVNKKYFGAYSSFGIHREMISDKLRTDAYKEAILSNSSLLNGATVMDLGCGTGILSLFAAQAGASRVNSIEASDKMARIATEIARDNGLLWSESLNQDCDHHTGVIKVFQGMVEDLDKSTEIQPQSIDVLISEWMGYCLLYESMLSSVLHARDRWLKPGGAILPDTATIFAAGFGRGGTSIPFWENVYGFNMSRIGREVSEDAARIPIVDVIDSNNIITGSVILKSFDLARMSLDEMDFTAVIELEPKFDSLKNAKEAGMDSCYGIVLWFETGFTSRFCKEKPTVLSTSPYGPSTHWAQTILTFREPITLTSQECNADKSAAIGSDGNPTTKLQARISIARGAEHRAIDISMEISGISQNGQNRSWPPQIFNLN